MKTNAKELAAPMDPKVTMTEKGRFSAKSLAAIRARTLSLMEWAEGQTFAPAIAWRSRAERNFSPLF